MYTKQELETIARERCNQIKKDVPLLVAQNDLSLKEVAAYLNQADGELRLLCYICDDYGYVFETREWLRQNYGDKL